MRVQRTGCDGRHGRQQDREAELVCDLLTLYRQEGESEATIAKLAELRQLRARLRQRTALH